MSSRRFGFTQNDSRTFQVIDNNSGATGVEFAVVSYFPEQSGTVRRRAQMITAALNAAAPAKAALTRLMNLNAREGDSDGGGRCFFCGETFTPKQVFCRQPADKCPAVEARVAIKHLDEVLL